MHPHAVIAPFLEAVRYRRQRLEGSASRGTKVIGYFCTYTPVELIHACGFLPVRIWGRTGPAEKACAQVPGFICPYMQLCLENALSGEFPFLSGLVQAYTCDVACGCVNIWKAAFPDLLVHSIPLPYNVSPEAGAYLRSCLEETVEKLVSAGGAFSDNALERSLDLYGRIREILSTLHEQRAQGTLALTSADLNVVVQAFFVSDPVHYLMMLERLVADLNACRSVLARGIPVLVSGSVVEDAGIVSLVEALGLRVAGDDLCTGLRAFTPASAPGESPLERVGNRIMKRFPCPARSRQSSRIPLLQDLAKSCGAQGVIFLFQKFCTPHLADYPAVSQALRDAGIPSILLELDGNAGMEAQTLTRLETFAGMVGA
jgi:benzoyl-CoA reductase/2-hydroxyglutaryl-CoA dehydratase subunit BcrC/BadD/HgdB